MELPPESLAADNTHPLPEVDVLDIYGIRKDGGGDLAIVIATPMQNDLRSRARLLKKIENYLGFVASPEFQSECGVPTAANTTITVYAHPDTDEGMFKFIEKCRDWIADNNANLVIEKRANKSARPNAHDPSSSANDDRT